MCFMLETVTSTAKNLSAVGPQKVMKWLNVFISIATGIRKAEAKIHQLVLKKYAGQDAIAH